jgi:hypothetical protein
LLLYDFRVQIGAKDIPATNFPAELFFSLLKKTPRIQISKYGDEGK